jgi:hypothetical protein
MTNHVPRQSGRTLADFDFRFLDPILSKKFQSEISGSADVLGRLSLGHGQKLHLRDVTIAPDGRPLHAPLNGLKVNCKIHPVKLVEQMTKTKPFLRLTLSLERQHEVSGLLHRGLHPR